MANQLDDNEVNGNVRIKIRNNIIEPNFETFADVPYIASRNLLYYLEQTAEGKQINEYFPTLGHMITSINGQPRTLDGSTWWRISRYPQEDGIPKGVSSYVPENGAKLLFELTQRSHDC